MNRILVVDDDEAISEMLSIVLENEGFETIVVNNGTDALIATQRFHPDLILLDVMLPGMNGIDVCRAVKEDSSVPIIMLTAKTDTVDVVLGLESGADDYINKPFKPQELIARVRTRLRSQESTQKKNIRIADIDIDIPGHQAYRSGEAIPLTPLEFDLLTTLASRPGEAFSREELLKEVWGSHHKEDYRLVNVHIQRLRSKVEHDPENPQVIITVRGLGYKTGV